MHIYSLPWFKVAVNLRSNCPYDSRMISYLCAASLENLFPVNITSNGLSLSVALIRRCLHRRLLDEFVLHSKTTSLPAIATLFEGNAGMIAVAPVLKHRPNASQRI